MQVPVQGVQEHAWVWAVCAQSSPSRRWATDPWRHFQGAGILKVIVTKQRCCFLFFTVFTFALMAKEVVSETLGSLAQWQAATEGQRSRSALPHTPDGKERALMEQPEWLFVSVFFIFCDSKWGVHCLVGKHVCTARWTSSFSLLEQHLYWKELTQTPHSLWADIFLKMNQVSLFLLGKQLTGFVASDTRWAFQQKLEPGKTCIHHHELDSFPLFVDSHDQICDDANKCDV